MKRLVPALRGIRIEYEDARLPGGQRKRAKRLRKNNAVKDRPDRPDRSENRETPAKQEDQLGTMIERSGRSRDSGGSKTVPDENPANGHYRDDGDGQDDDLRAGSNVSSFLANPPDWYRRQAEECARQGSPERLLKPLASAVAYHVLGTTNLWSEVLPQVEAASNERSPV